MLSPEYYEGCADDILSLCEQLEDDIISDIVRRIMKTGIVTETARHQIEQLQEAGLLYDDILNIIASQTDATAQHVRALFEDAGVETVSIDNEVYYENGLVPVDIRQSPAMRQTLEAGYRKTLGNMKNLTLTTANTSQTAYINACNQAYMQITSGAFSYQEAIKQAIQKTAQNGATVTYPSGHTECIDVAVRRAVLTGVGQTCREIGMMNAEECGCDLMEISAHSGARPDHAKWQGKIVSLSGRRGYLSLKDIGYGTGDGFGGWNCRHDWYPFFEGYSKPNYTKKQLEELDEKNIEYNGKLYNQYEISQIQRRYEREIRAAKREQVAFKVAVDEAKDPELKQVMQDSLNYSNSLVKDRQAKMRDFIRQTGQDRDYFREQNYPKENPRNNLTYDINDGKILDKKSGIYVKTKYYNCEVKHYVITDERINNIKPVKLSRLSEENNKKLTSACKDLLSYVRNEPLGTEALMAFDMNMNLLSKYKSPHNRGSVSLSEWEQDCIVIHNHPSGMLFSPKDYEQFSNMDSIRIFGAVGNDGSIYFIEKTDDFNALQYDFDYFQLQYKYGYFDDKGEYHFNSDTDKLLFSEEFIDGGENSGFKAYISTNK